MDGLQAEIKGKQLTSRWILIFHCTLPIFKIYNYIAFSSKSYQGFDSTEAQQLYQCKQLNTVDPKEPPLATNGK